jgi:hypothetical protein
MSNNENTQKVGSNPTATTILNLKNDFLAPSNHLLEAGRNADGARQQWRQAAHSRNRFWQDLRFEIQFGSSVGQDFSKAG